jgi:hypothetical protein
MLVLAVVADALPAAQAQTYTVLHNFTGGADGGVTQVGLTMDAAGNFYGTTYYGGNNELCAGRNCGTVFKLARSGSGWILAPIYSFAGGTDGANPYSRATIAPDGTLYGAASTGGGTGCNGVGCGAIFHLTPPLTAPHSAVVTWNETILYRFTGASDEAHPWGDLTLDQAGSIYGTAARGGSTTCSAGGCGVTYKLTRSGNTWTETTLYSPQLGDPVYPAGGVVMDGSGNLYGVFEESGQYDGGAVYELSPSESGWTEQTIYRFTSGTDGGNPLGGLIFDSSGNLWGTTTSGGNGSGTAFELSTVNGGWSFDAFYAFASGSLNVPSDKLLMDSAGNLYGTTSSFLDNSGTAYKLSSSNGSWTESDLHQFDLSNGSVPMSVVVSDANGHLYGTASAGGSSGSGCLLGNGCGVIWEITP